MSHARHDVGGEDLQIALERHYETKKLSKEEQEQFINYEYHFNKPLNISMNIKNDENLHNTNHMNNKSVSINNHVTMIEPDYNLRVDIKKVNNSNDIKRMNKSRKFINNNDNTNQLQSPVQLQQPQSQSQSNGMQIQNQNQSLTENQIGKIKINQLRERERTKPLERKDSSTINQQTEDNSIDNSINNSQYLQAPYLKIYASGYQKSSSMDLQEKQVVEDVLSWDQHLQSSSSVIDSNSNSKKINSHIHNNSHNSNSHNNGHNIHNNGLLNSPSPERFQSMNNK